MQHPLFRLAEAGTLNRGFKFGDGLFETMAVWQNKILHLAYHLQRLKNGMDALGFDNPDEVTAILQTISLPGYARFRLSVYRGGGGAFTPETNCWQAVGEMTPIQPQHLYNSQPIRLWPVYTLRLGQTPVSSYKTLSALHYVYAAHQAQINQYDDGLIFNRDGLFLETSRANVFAVHNNTLFTPPISDGCVDGVMRRVVLGLAQTLGLKTYEQSFGFQPDWSYFTTNAIAGITPILCIGHQKIPPAKETENLIAALKYQYLT